MKNNILIKSISYLLLVSIVYMYICSALCATGTHGCCGKEDNDNDNCKKKCCKKENKSESKDNDCQTTHFAFFNATGQFSQVKTDVSFKSFQPLAAIISTLFIIKTVPSNTNIFAYNGFHPPPPKADTRIFIQSFQI